MKYNDPFYWDWEDSIFKDYLPQRGYLRRLENLAKEYDVPPVKKIDDFPLGEIFFTKTGRSSSATEMKVQKPRGNHIVDESDHFTVDFETYNGMGPIRKNGRIWDTDQIRSELGYMGGPVLMDRVSSGTMDDFYDALAYCFNLTKSSNEKPILNDRPYHKGYPE